MELLMEFKIILQTIKNLIPIVIFLMMAVEKQNSEGLYFGENGCLAIV